MLTNYNGKAITYDAIGNPLNWRNAFMLEWYGRNLITFAKPTGEMYAYTYNADGIRTSKNYYNAGGNLIGTDEYIYDGTKLIAENRSGTWLYYFYDANGTITGMSYGGTLYYFRKNLQGDVTGIYNATGTLVVEYEYTPYGALLAVTDANGNDISANATHIANINPIRYRGYYYDTETELYYLITRYYDPQVGRFLNADAYASTGQGIIGNNMFAYCNNNPVISCDPFGLCSVCDNNLYGPCSDLHKEQEKKQKSKTSYATPSKCPPAVQYEITKLDIPKKYSAVKVEEDSSGYSYLGSYTSYPYIVFRFCNRAYTSDYYFTKITVEQKLNRLGIERYVSHYAMKGSFELSNAGAANGAPPWLELGANACGLVNPFMERWHYNVQDDIEFYESMEGAAYVFQKVYTYKNHDFLRGNATPIVYP